MNVLALFQPIKVFVFDMDGVLTNGQLLVTADGDLLRSMSVKDGYALQLALKKGYEIAVISGGKSEHGKRRLEKLGIEKVFLGVNDKADLLQKLMTENQWTKEQTLYMGDDVPDMECLSICGLTTCPKDAASEVRAFCSYISPFEGGKGCVRDVIEKVLKLQGNWPAMSKW